MVKIVDIWILWFQGFDSDELPWLNRECINAWKKLNEDDLDFRINLLDEKELYKLLPEIKEIFNNSIHERTLQTKSDLARLMLLNKYGGIWVDASLFPMYPISNFFSKLVNTEEFFAYRFFPPKIDGNGTRVISNWFLISLNPENYIVSQWLKKFKEKFIGDYFMNYFEHNYTFSDLYFSDSYFAKIINNMVQKSEENPHSIIRNGFEKRLDSFLYKRPVHNESKLKKLNSGKYEIKMLKKLINKTF